MISHRVPVLILCALAIAACQPSQAPALQTQDAQSAFNLAVDAAQTHTASTPAPIPISGLLPTSPPASVVAVPTDLAADLEAQAFSVQTLMDGYIGMLRTDGLEPFDVHATALRYEYYDGGSAALMDVGVQRGADTQDAAALAAALCALSAVFSTGLDAAAADRQRAFLPGRLGRFRIHIYDTTGREWTRITGDWEDILAHAAGWIEMEALIDRLTFQRFD